MAEQVIDLLDGTRTILRALQGRLARDIAAGKSVPKGEQRQLVELTERIERIRPTAPSWTPDPAEPLLEPRRRCSAKSKRSQVQCQRWATKGSPTCHIHGGKTPQTRARTERLVAIAEVRAHRGIPLDVEPHEAVLDAVREAAGNVAMFRERMAEEEHTNYGYDYSGKLYTNPTIVAYDEERDRLVRFCKLASDMRIDETRVRLAQAQGQALAVVVLAAVNACNPDAEERAAALRAAGAHMRAIGAGEALPVEP